MVGESAWWAAQLNSKGLTQGDIIAPVPIGTARVPVTFLGRDVWPRREKNYWPQTPELSPFHTDQTGLFIARGPVTHSLVVSHSYELDDKPDVGRVLVAIIAPLDRVEDAEMRARILNQKRRAFMPLPGVPGMGDMYADLRCTTYVDRKLIPDSHRVVSMSDAAIVRLRSQLIAYFTRLDPSRFAEAIKTGLEEENRPE